MTLSEKRRHTVLEFLRRNPWSTSRDVAVVALGGNGEHGTNIKARTQQALMELFELGLVKRERRPGEGKSYRWSAV